MSTHQDTSDIGYGRPNFSSNPLPHKAAFHQVNGWIKMLRIFDRVIIIIVSSRRLGRLVLRNVP